MIPIGCWSVHGVNKRGMASNRIQIRTRIDDAARAITPNRGRGLVLAAWLALTLLLSGCGPAEQKSTAPGTPPGAAGDRIRLQPVKFRDLPGWRDDASQEVLPALRKSCPALSRQVTATQGPQFWSAGEAVDWQPICSALRALGDATDDAARQFFEQWFTPYLAVGKSGETGLFTGYYEMEMEGSRQKDSRFSTPLYALPADIVTIDLGLFRSDLKGRKLSGRMIGKEMRPYHSRSEIEAGVLAGRNLEIVYVTPIDAFFLAVQGSGRVVVTEKNGESKTLRVGYAGSNGQSYQSIGNELIRRGILPASEVTAAAIRLWLSTHVEQAAMVMNTNASYVFFRELPGNDDGPVGAANLSLTPLRSLAVDPNFIPLGLPLWLDLDMGDQKWPRPLVKDQKLRRLVVTQDVGGAIKGPVRGDFFCGHGAAAEDLAGRMKQSGQYFVLLPKTVPPPS
ncbi:MAG: MltA domain-containing protein [Candidatus Symbiobacter sp.]|nr:MltA domain-containing protein [Candidatus Symbiobacter sp.]